VAAPSYTEDLTDLSLDAASGWVEMTGSVTLSGGSEAFNTQGAPAYEDPDYPFIQGLYSVTQDCTKDVGVGSLAFNNGAGTGGHGTDGAYLVWQNYMVASNIETYANDGFMLVVGSSTSDFDVWTVGGVDKAPYPYGGWVNHAVNTSVTADYTAGTPNGTEQYIGAAVYVTTGSSKGEVHNVDAIRYGRCSAIFEHGDITNGYCTFDGFATVNDYNDATNGYNRWGLLSKTSGGYLWKGRMSLGTATNAVDFRDSNKTVFIQWTPKVTANFNLIECLNTGSNIEWTGITIQTLDTTTASKGRFLMTDQCDVALDQCNFIDMDTFVFSKGATKTVDITNGSFRRCAQITQGGATITGNLISNSTSQTSIVVDDLSLVTGNTFISDGTNHAVDLGNITSSTTVTWNNILSGYATGTTGDPITEDDTTNAAILVNVSAGQKLTINIASGATIPSVKNDGTGTVAVVANQRTLSFNVSPLPSPNYEWRLYSTDTAGEFDNVTEINGVEQETSATKNSIDTYTYAANQHRILQIISNDYVEYNDFFTLEDNNMTRNITLTPDDND